MSRENVNQKHKTHGPFQDHPDPPKEKFPLEKLKNKPYKRKEG